MTAGPLRNWPTWRPGERGPWWAPLNVRKPTRAWHWAKRWAWLYGYPLTAIGLEELYGEGNTVIVGVIGGATGGQRQSE